MLVLSRKIGEAVVIQGQIEITILAVDGETVKVGISAPRDIEVLRKELIDSVTATNQEAANPEIELIHKLIEKTKS
ncbi:carbon storage regulator CsrA [Cohnella pontilimi]|uniref:Translational regulator CsrA n=1 Tax=Cohnella pontilimi TaxID=2564100 RepID=A0A4U0FB92_9BACL|nr:carbon storage regulator CsrA [Cohnella pontilimi]TJY41951.1 carbon storage regulator CsrA [Cohnella pontilimi]